MSKKVSKYNYPASSSGGVQPMSIRGIFEDERHRLSEEFTDEERKWRKQWLEDQKLSANEPRPVSQEWIKLTRNPLRRALSKPWQLLENGMIPIFGKTMSAHFRYVVPRLILATCAVYFSWYHLKYNQNDWTRHNGWKVYMPKPVAYPGDPNYPAKRERSEPSDYADRGFKARKVFLD